MHTGEGAFYKTSSPPKFVALSDQEMGEKEKKRLPAIIKLHNFWSTGGWKLNFIATGWCVMNRKRASREIKFQRCDDQGVEVSENG